MPLSEKGKKIQRAMVQHYGPENGKQVFYASENKGTIQGVKKHNPGLDSSIAPPHLGKIKMGNAMAMEEMDPK